MSGSIDSYNVEQTELAQAKVANRAREWFVRRWVVMKRSFPYEWAVFKRAWPMIIVGVIFQLLHNWAHNGVFWIAAHYRVYGGPENRLVDMGYELFPSLEHLPFLPSNGCLYFLFVAAIAFAIRSLFFNVISGSLIQMVWRLLIVCSMTIVFRCCAFLVTILPSPAPHCSAAEFKSPDVDQIFGRLDTDGGCSDLIFSSHMMYGGLCCLLVAHYSIVPHKRAGKRVPLWQKCLIVFMYCVLLAEGLCIVAQRAHYSVDVLISLYTIPATWLSFYVFVPNDPLPRISAKSAAQLDTQQENATSLTDAIEMQDIETGNLQYTNGGNALSQLSAPLNAEGQDLKNSSMQLPYDDLVTRAHTAAENSI